MSDTKIVVVGSDSVGKSIAAKLRHEQATQNIQIITGLHSLGLPMDLAEVFGATPLTKPVKKPRELTDQDRERMAAAEAKRQRKAAKRVKDKQ